MNIQEIRKKYPQYDHLSDEELADSLHATYYATLPKEQFYSKIGLPFEKPKQPSIYSEIKESFQGIPEGIINGIMNLPGQAVESGEQILSHPGRAALNVAAGLGEGGIGAFNMPYNLAQYLKNKEVPYFKQTADWVPHIPDLGIEKKLGLDNRQPGDELLRNISSMMPFMRFAKGAEGLQRISKLSQAGAAHALATNQNPIQEAVSFPLMDIATKAGGKLIGSAVQRGLNAANINKFKAAAEKAGLHAEDIDRMLNESKLASKNELGTPDPDQLMYEATQSHPEEMNNLSQQIKEIEPYNPNNRLPSPEGESLIPEANLNLKTAQQKAAESESKINESLGEGQAHHVRFGKLLTEKRNAIEQQNQHKYGQLEKNLSENNIELANTDNVHHVISAINQISKNSSLWGPEDYTALKDVIQLSEGPKRLDIPARKLLAIYRSARDAEHKARQEAKYNTNDEMRQAYRDQAQEIGKQKDRLYEILKQGIGPNNTALLEDATKEFREKIAPMRENSVFREVAKTGKVKGSILEKLESTEYGHKQLNDIVNSDPEFARLILGQEFAGKPEKLLHYNEMTEPHLANRPDIQHMLNEHRENIGQVEEAQQGVSEAKKLTQSLEDEAERVRKSYKEQVGLNLTRDQAIQKYQQIEQLIPRKIAVANELRRLADKKQNSLNEKMRYEAAYKKAQKDINNLKYYSKTLAKYGALTVGTGLGIGAGSSIINKLMR